MISYATNDPKFMSPAKEKRFQVIGLYPGTGVWMAFLVDTWRELNTPKVFPKLGQVQYRILKELSSPTFDQERTLKDLAEEMNIIAEFHYYLDHC